MVGGKLVSSIESLNFSVTSEEDVVITVKDVTGWQLDQASQMVIHSSLTFTNIPEGFRLFNLTANLKPVASRPRPCAKKPSWYKNAW